MERISSRGRSVKRGAEESGSIEQEEDEEDEDEEEDKSCCTWRYSTAILWCVGWGIASLSGFLLGESRSLLGGNPMWNNNFFSEYVPPRRIHQHMFRSRDAFLSLGDSRNATGLPDLWGPLPEAAWKACATRKQSKTTPATENGYLQVSCSGGLFQLHICVCNAVATAKMLNATLLIPFFRKSPVWKDPSKFHDIYDIDHFMSDLRDDLSIVRSLPTEYEWSIPELYETQCEAHANCIPFVPKHATMGWHLNNVVPILRSYGVAAIPGYNHKLSFEDLPSDVVRVRCRANFYALKFVNPIVEFTEVLVTRLKTKASLLEKSSSRNLDLSDGKLNGSDNWWNSFHIGGFWRRRLVDPEVPKELSSIGGKFLGLHLRFEKDMVAKSTCYYDGGRAELRALEAFRRNVLRGRDANARLDPSFLRANGSCLLTPEEMGLLLAALGFKNDTVVYTAGKSIYGGTARLQPLKNLFPLLENKETLATPQELEQFLPYAHKLAAVDFLVLLNSNIFMSNAAGNFPNVLTGQRTFWGFRKSIHPDKGLLARLLSNTTLSWEEFSNQLSGAHSVRLGAAIPRKRKFSVFRYPVPDCMCQI